MFISIEKATALTGKSKNALYRLMAKGHIHFVHCTKGKRYLEVAELKRVYGPLLSEASEDAIVDEMMLPDNSDLPDIVSALRTEVANLAKKVDKQTQLLESLTTTLTTTGVAAITSAPQHAEAQVTAITPARPEQDPEWPPFITCYADLAKRDEIKAKYNR